MALAIAEPFQAHRAFIKRTSMFASVQKICLFSVILLLSSVFTQAGEVPLSTREAIESRLLTVQPHSTVEDITASPLPGIYMARLASGTLLYMSEDGSYILVGDLYEAQQGELINLSEEVRKETRKAKLEGLNMADMIIFKPRGKTKAIVNVFTDVDCGYCRKFHQEVAQLNDKGVEVRYLAYPRAGVGSATYEHMVSAWCAKDRHKALTALKNGEEIPNNFCPGNPVAAQYQLGNALGVRGTPTLVMMDGTLTPGYLPAKDLLQVLGVE